MRCLAVLVLFFCCCCAAPSTRTPRPRPGPLDSSDTWNNVMVMAKHAQELDKDHETRLIPRIPGDKLKHGDACCVSVKILDYYLNNILHADHKHIQRMNLVQPDLARVAKDLKPHCNFSQTDLAHFHSFTENFKIAGQLYKSNSTAQNKAIGETDILFHYLYESCTAMHRA